MLAVVGGNNAPCNEINLSSVFTPAVMLSAGEGSVCVIHRQLFTVFSNVSDFTNNGHAQQMELLQLGK